MLNSIILVHTKEKDIMENTVVTKEMLIQGLKELGLKDAMKLIVHSSLKSFGTVEGGSEGVIDAITEIIGTEGTLLMPSFNTENHTAKVKYLM